MVAEEAEQEGAVQAEEAEQEGAEGAAEAEGEALMGDADVEAYPRGVVRSMLLSTARQPPPWPPSLRPMQPAQPPPQQPTSPPLQLIAPSWRRPWPSPSPQPRAFPPRRQSVRRTCSRIAPCRCPGPVGGVPSRGEKKKKW